MTMRVQIGAFLGNDSDNEGQQIYQNNQHAGTMTDDDKKITDTNKSNCNQQSHNNNLCTQTDNQEFFAFIKDGMGIGGTCLKIGNDPEVQKIGENMNQHSNISVGYTNNDTRTTKEFPSRSIDTVSHENQVIQKINSYTNKSIDSDNNDKNLELTSLECLKQEQPNQYISNKKRTEQPNQCNICKKIISSKYNLSAHLNKHTGEKPHQCNICDKRFTLRCGLRRHIITHTGERPYQCHICRKRFSNKSNLSAHFKKHTGEKPFQCNICDKKFTLKGNLKKHSLIHSG